MKIGNVTFDKNQLNALIFGFLVLLLPAAVYLASNVTQDQRAKAAPTSQLSMVLRDQNGNIINANPDNTHTVTQGQQITVDIMMTTGDTPIELVNANLPYPTGLTLNYNPTKVGDDGSQNPPIAPTTNYYESSDIECGNNPSGDPLTINADDWLFAEWTRNVHENIATGTLTKIQATCVAGNIAQRPIMARLAPANSTVKVNSMTFTVSQAIPSLTLTLDSNTFIQQSSCTITTLDCEANASCDPNTDPAVQSLCANVYNSAQAPSLTITTNVYVPPTNTPTPTPTNTPTPTVTPTPPSGTGPSLSATMPANAIVGSQVALEIYVDSASVPVTGVDAVMNFDPTVFQVVSVTKNDTATGGSFTNFVPNTTFVPASYFNNTAGIIDISATVSTAQQSIGVTPSSELFATVLLDVIGTPVSNPSAITFDYTAPPPEIRNDSNIANLSGSDILSEVFNTSSIVAIAPTVTPTPTTTIVPPTATPTVTPTPTNTPIPTATPTPTNTPTPTATPAPQDLVINMELQGRTWKSNILSRIVNIFTYQNGSELASKRIYEDPTSPSATPVRTDVLGALTINSYLTDPGANPYTIVIQPRGYLNKAQSPVNVGGIFNLDLTGNQFFAGDLDMSGKVTGADYSILISNFKADTTGDLTGTTNASIADLDGSGQINSLDFSLLLSNYNYCGQYLDSLDSIGNPGSDGVLDTQADVTTCGILIRN